MILNLIKLWGHEKASTDAITLIAGIILYNQPQSLIKQSRYDECTETHKPTAFQGQARRPLKYSKEPYEEGFELQ